MKSAQEVAKFVKLTKTTEGSTKSMKNGLPEIEAELATTD